MRDTCAGDGVCGWPRGRWTVTAGPAGHGPVAACGTAARAAAFSVSQPSAGQVRGWIPLTTRDPTDPPPARRQSAGVAVGETSLQRSPPIPTTITWPTGGALTAAVPRVPAGKETPAFTVAPLPAPLLLAAAGAARARMAAPATSAPPKVTRTRSTVSRARRWRCPVRGWVTAGAGPAARRRQVQMFWLAVLGAKVEAGCGVVRGPALAVLP